MPIDQTPEPLGFRGLGHVPGLVMTPDESAIKPQQAYVTDVPGQDEPIERAPSPSFGQQIADIGTTALGLMSPAATIGRMVGRKIAGGPLIAPQEQRILDLGAASYRQENEVVGAFRSVFSDKDFGDSDPLHNPWDVIAGTTLEPYWQYFVGSRNARETEWLRDRLMQELSDRELLADNPLLGSALAMMASIVSPTTLLPGGAIYRGLKGAERVVAGARTAATVGTMGAVGVGAQEWLLHQQQMARTFGESAFAVGGAFLLGGVLGGVISGSASKRIGRLAEALEREIHVPPRSGEDIYGMGGLNTARGVGAQATDAKPPVELEGTGIGMQRWMRFQDPVLRTLNSPIRTAREVGTQLYETVLGVTRNAEGVTTAPVGGAVETRIKTQGQARLGEAMRQTDELFAEYYFGKTDAAFAAVRSEIGRLQGSQKLTAKQFKEEIGRAMARADEHAIPQVAQAAKIWRKVLIDPIADAAIKQKLLDPDVVAKGRPKSGGGSTPPAGGTPAPQGPRGPGPGGTGGNAGPDLPFDIQRMRQIEANVQALQTELGLPPMSEALREAFFQRMSKALEDVTIDPATRALLDVLEGRTPRVEVDQDIAKRLQEALQAQRAASGAGVAADVQKAASDALGRLNEVLPDEFVPKAMKMLEDAFSGRMPSLDEIVDLFAPKMAKVEMSPISPFRIRQNAIKGEVEAIKEMWRLVATVPNKPPEGLVSWMVRSGGVVDAQGDIAAMLGAKNKRPGLLRTSGPQLDDVALRAWEEGFLPGDVLPDGTVGRPTINQLLDAVRDDLYAGHPAERVIRATDREALDLWVQASEFRRELRDMGITPRMGEASVEKVAERFAAERFDAGLDGPAAAVMAAHANHMLRMMDKFMETGKTYSIGHHVHQKIKETLGDDVKRVADDTVVATAERFVPKGTMRFNGEITPKVEITFRTFDDDLLTVTLPWSQARDLRAAHFPVNSIPGFNGRAIVFFRSTLSNSDSFLRKTLGGELIHELVHNQVSDLGVSHLTRPLWDRLVRHAEGLRVLEMDQKQYMAAIAHPSARADAPDVTMRERYEERYSGRANKDQMLREESVAHMLELWRHGQWMKSELEPIADILRAFERNDLKSQSVLDDLLEAERVRAEAEVAAIAAERAAMKKASEDMMFAINAWHGSPHDFAAVRLVEHPDGRREYVMGEPGRLPDVPEGARVVQEFPAGRFSMEHIGRGEGAQAFGHGLYFGEAKGTGQRYQDILSKHTVRLRGVENPTRVQQDLLDMLSGVGADDRLMTVAGLRSELKAVVRDSEQAFAMYGHKATQERIAKFKAYQAELEKIADQIEIVPGGHLYEVRLDVDHADLLDWDKPLSQQSEKVRGAFPSDLHAARGAEAHDVMAQRLASAPPADADSGWTSIVNTINDRVQRRDLLTERLREAGVPGIRYLDQASRRAGEGSRNIVIFDDSLVEIISKDGKPVSKAERAQVIEQMKGEQSGLDMSPEARKARAEEMGFDTRTVYHHTSNSTFDAFDLARGGGALGPSFAKGEAVYQGPHMGQYYLRLRKSLSFNTGFEVTPRELVRHLIDGRYTDFNGDVKPVGLEISPADKKVLAATIEKNGWDADRAQIVRDVLRRHDIDGFEFVHEGMTEAIVFDPSNIRSVNAAFDPAESASSKLMAALGPSGGKSSLGKAIREWLGQRRGATGRRDDIRMPPAMISRARFDEMAKAIPRKPRAVADVSVIADKSGDYVQYFVVPRGQRSAWAKDGSALNHLGSFSVKAGQHGGVEVTYATLKDHMQRRGIGSTVYDLIERDFPDATLMPSPWNQLSEAAVAFWSKRAPERLTYQRARAARELGGDLYPERKIAWPAGSLDEGQPMFALGPSGQKPKPKADDLARRLYERVRAEVADELEKPKPKAGEDPPAFDPETAKVIYDDEGQSYISRLYKRWKIIAERGQFRDILIEHFAAGQQRAERLLKQITDDIKAGRKAPDAKTETQIEQLREFTGLERKDLHDIAEKVIQHILGEAEGRMTFDLPAAVRGPLKARTLRIRDELIEDFLDRDIERIGRHYVRGMVPDIELTRMFGSVDMKEPIQKIWDEATRLGDANPKNREAIHAQAKAAVRDLLAIRDRLRGTYMLPEDPTAILPRIGSVIRTLNYMRLLGGMTISAVPDTARVVMTHGIVSTFRDGLVPLLTSLSAVKAAGREVKLAGTALDMILDTRAMGIADVLDDFGRYSKFERGLQKAQEHFGVLSLMAPWNAGMKQWVGMIVMSNIMREGEHLLMGKALSKAALKRLAASNIDLDMLQIIAEQWKKHGTKTGNVYLPNTTKWDLDKPNVQLALDAFRGAIVRDVDRIVVTPGQDKPLWMSTQIGKIVGQFKSFGVASVQRTLIAGLQQRDAGVVLGFAMAIGLGAVVEALKNKLAGKDNPKTTAQWVVNAIDKSGLTGWLYDINHFSERFTGGTVGLAALTGRPISRFAARNWADAIGGPSAGLLKDLAGSNASLFRWAFNNEKPTEADVRALRRTIPLQNLFYLSWLFRELEEGTAKAIGARPSPKRN